MPQEQRVLSTDPNAGEPLTGSAILSTDPNAGEAIEERGLLGRAADFATTSLIPGLTEQVRSRDADAGFYDPDVPLSHRLLEGSTTPLGLAGELVGVLGILRGLRGPRVPVRPAPPGVPGGNLTRGGQVVRSTAPAVARQAGLPEQEFSGALGSVLARLRAEGRPVSVGLPPGPAQPPVSFPSVSAAEARLRRAAAQAQRQAAATGDAAPATAQAAAIPETGTAFPGTGLPETIVARPPAAPTPLPRLAESVAARPTTPAEEVVAALREQSAARTGEVVFDSRLASSTPPAPTTASTALPESVEDAAMLRGRRSLVEKLPEGATVPPEEMHLLDKLASAYRQADQMVSEAQRGFMKGEVSTEAFQQARVARREAGKALRQNELRILKAAEESAKKGLKSEAGILAPQLAQAVFGGTIGGATGAGLDPENPVRGFALGALAGAAAPGTVIGTAKSIRSQGLRAVGKVYISGLLSGPMTAVRNVTSVAANGLFRAVSHPASVAFDAARSAVKGTPRTVTLGDITPATIATWTGFKRGASDALTTFITGQSPYTELFHGAPIVRNELHGGLANAANWVPRALDALDTWMGRIVEAQTVASRAYVEGFNRGGNIAQRWQMVGQLQGNPTPAIKAAADFEARRQLFRGDAGKVANMFITLRSGLNSISKLPIGDFIIPFVRVPSQIAKQAVEGTPFGLLQDVSTLGAREQAEHFGRVFTGSLVMGTGAYAALEGRISGRGPSKPNDRMKLQETGWRPYAVNTPTNILGLGTQAEDGSYWIPLNALGPIGMMLGTVADTLEGWKELDTDEDTRTQQVINLTGRFASSFADQTFLTDAMELAESLNNPQMFERYVSRKAGSLVPAAVRETAKIYDPISRETTTPQDAIQANIPGLSRSVPARTDRFGQEIRRPSRSAPPIQHPAREVVESAGAALNKSQGRITVSPTTDDGRRLRQVLESAGFEFDDNDVIKLTPAERRRLQQQRGQQLADILARLRNAPTYRALPPDAQKIIIERLKRRVESDRRMPELLELLQQRQAGSGR